MLHLVNYKQYLTEFLVRNDELPLSKYVVSAVSFYTISNCYDFY